MQLGIPSEKLLAITRSKAKMWEFDVPEESHIGLLRPPADLLPATIGIIGELAARINRKENPGFEDFPASTAAVFFEAYANSRLYPRDSQYMTLLAAAGYYLAEHPGSTSVLISGIDSNKSPFTNLGFEACIFRILRGSGIVEPISYDKTPYDDLLGQLLGHYSYFRESGNQTGIEDLLSSLRQSAYDYATEKDLFLADVLCSLVRKAIENSVWNLLPGYSALPLEAWAHVFSKPSFPKELWPAQKALGNNEIFLGHSAIVQMPTSAGKTKAIEIIVRSSFLSGRAKLAVIVTPFRALCHEVSNTLLTAFQNENVAIDELSDVLQNDFNEINADRATIIVVTPEKLLYVVRHNAQFSSQIGLLIYDEGHQFDSGRRGVTYELLLSTLKNTIPGSAQTVLISAVITAAQQIAEWLLRDQAKVVNSDNVHSTFRTIAFTTWNTELGQLHYVDNRNPDEQEYFVPRLIEQEILTNEDGDVEPFPMRDDSGSIAAYLALKVARQGTVALFSGTKLIAVSQCKKLVANFENGLEMPSPAESADRGELDRLAYQAGQNIGEDSDVTQAILRGILSHHANIPFGMRMAVETAIRLKSARMVICTSTLAQGVNMPIRYLVFPNVYQAGERLSRRDFTNLIGRAGRAGMHTEGTIIFADNLLYQNRKRYWRDWQRMKLLLSKDTPDETAGSSLLDLFKPWSNRYETATLEVDIAEMLGYFVQGKQSFANAYTAKLTRFSVQNNSKISEFENQIEDKYEVIAQTQSFLLAHTEDSPDAAVALARDTLAYALASPQKREHLEYLFSFLSANIRDAGLSPEKRRAFGKTLLTLIENQQIEKWVEEYRGAISDAPDDDTLFDTLWPLIRSCITNHKFLRINASQQLIDQLAKGWFTGRSFIDLLKPLSIADARIGFSKRPRHITVYHVVDICESAFSFDGMLIVGAIKEAYESLGENGKLLETVQQRMKYGLKTRYQVWLYERGLKDRCLVQELAILEAMKDIHDLNRLREVLREDPESIQVLARYPTHFARAIAGDSLG